MYPTLSDCEVVLVDKQAEIRVGDIVVAKHPIEQDTELVKRVESINKDGNYFLVGDNLENSNDSRHFGALTKDYQGQGRRALVVLVALLWVGC